jgi:hypothetical protein
MTLGINTNRFVVVECVQNFTFSALGCPFLLANRTVHGESDEHFSHNTLLEEYGVSAFSGDHCLRVKAEFAAPAGEDGVVFSSMAVSLR